MRLYEKDFEKVEFAKILKGVLLTIKNLDREGKLRESEFKEYSSRGNWVFKNRLDSMQAGYNDEDYLLMSYSTIVAMDWDRYTIEFGYYSTSTSRQVSRWAYNTILRLDKSVDEILRDYDELMMYCNKVLGVDEILKDIEDLKDDIEIYNGALKNEIDEMFKNATDEIKREIYREFRLEA